MAWVRAFAVHPMGRSEDLAFTWTLEFARAPEFRPAAVVKPNYNILHAFTTPTLAQPPLPRSHPTLLDQNPPAHLQIFNTPHQNHEHSVCLSLCLNMDFGKTFREQAPQLLTLPPLDLAASSIDLQGEGQRRSHLCSLPDVRR